MPAVSDDLRAARAHAYEAARPEILALVPPGARRVLDLGCASGALGAALKARSAGEVEVVGVERDPAYAADARERLDRVIEGDLDTLEAPGLGRFDCLVAADVLEHLVDPWAALGRFAALLDPGCRAIVSLPNVRYWETFWALGVRGTWPRRPEGVFDATHLRWFTLRDAHALLGGAGLEVELVDRRMRMRRHASPWDRLARPLAPVPGARAVLTYQHVIAARQVR